MVMIVRQFINIKIHVDFYLMSQFVSAFFFNLMFFLYFKHIQHKNHNYLHHKIVLYHQFQLASIGDIFEVSGCTSIIVIFWYNNNYCYVSYIINNYNNNNKNRKYYYLVCHWYLFLFYVVI